MYTQCMYNIHNTPIAHNSHKLHACGATILTMTAQASVNSCEVFSVSTSMEAVVTLTVENAKDMGNVKEKQRRSQKS